MALVGWLNKELCSTQAVSYWSPYFKVLWSQMTNQDLSRCQLQRFGCSAITGQPSHSIRIKDFNNLPTEICTDKKGNTGCGVWMHTIPWIHLQYFICRNWNWPQIYSFLHYCVRRWQFAIAPLRGFMEDLVTAVIAEVLNMLSFSLNRSVNC